MATTLSDEEILAQIPPARARAQPAIAEEPRAKSASYDSRRRLVFVELTNGYVFGFPTHAAEGLQGASADDLASVEVSPSGLGLHWETLDADLLVPALLQGMFGTKTWMTELARKAGSTASDAKEPLENKGIKWVNLAWL